MARDAGWLAAQFYDVNGWRLKAMLGYPRTWRLSELNLPKSN
jgi:hypothetical protein